MGQTIQKERNGFLDALKGLAILLVVVGHAIQTLPNFDQNIVFRIIYSFHMPLFMFLSGAVVAFSLKPMGWDFIKKKALLLLVPFVAWYVVSYVANGAYHSTSFAHYIKQWIFAPDFGLWFLWVLFLNFCALALAKNLHKIIGTASFVLVWFLIVFGLPHLPQYGHFGSALFQWHFTFFLVGYLIFLYREKLASYRKPVLALCAVAFPILVVAWHRNAMPDFNAHWSAVFARRNLGDTYNLLLTLYTYAVPLAGIGAMFVLLRLAASKYLYAALGWIGLLTMEIYVSHQYFFQFAQGQGLVHITTGVVFALGGSLLIALLVLQRSAILSQIFLGGRSAAKRQAAKLPVAEESPAPVGRQEAVPQAAD